MPEERREWGHAGVVYELGGRRPTCTELAEVHSGIVGVPVTYTDLPKEEHSRILEIAGVPAQFATVLADSDADIALGALDTDSGDLERLIGCPAPPAAEAIGARQPLIPPSPGAWWQDRDS